MIGQGRRKGLDGILPDQVDRVAAEAGAGQAGPDAAGDRAGGIDQDVQFPAGNLIVGCQALVRPRHQPTHRRTVTPGQGDLGRQAEPPQKLVNRWIVPLEESKDILTLQSGEKFEVPFDTLVIFSTNFQPNEIFDKAALRRIFFKIKIDGPNQENFLKIFAMVAKKKKMALDEKALVHLLKVKYPTIDNIYANYQPIFLIDQMIAICNFEGIPYQMSPELIDRAWANMFVRDEKIAH